MREEGERWKSDLACKQQEGDGDLSKGKRKEGGIAFAMHV